MISKTIKKPVILGILFFLPVIFLLFLIPADHNYEPLDVVNENVTEFNQASDDLKLTDQITVLAFFGEDPMKHVIAASNLKELIYDKFMGFKKFQVVVVLPNKAAEDQANLEAFKKEISRFETLEYWKYLVVEPEEVETLFNSLLTKDDLLEDLSSENVYIIDKDVNQRGRLDDRTDKEIEKNEQPYPLYAYNCIEIKDLKDKMSEDVRILFTEYRQKRKGTFNSSQRRADDIKGDEKN